MTLSIGVPSPVSENGQPSVPRTSSPVTTMGIVAPPRRPVMVPWRIKPVPHSAENLPDASVAVWVVTAHAKFEQLEKSGSAVAVDERVTDAVVEVPCTIQVPSRDGVEDLEVDVPALAVVGPSTVDVRSTLHAVMAPNAAISELNRTNDLFMG